MHTHTHTHTRTAITMSQPASVPTSVEVVVPPDWRLPWTAREFDRWLGRHARANPALNAYLAVPRPIHRPMAHSLRLAAGEALLRVLLRAGWEPWLVRRVVAFLVWQP